LIEPFSNEEEFTDETMSSTQKGRIVERIVAMMHGDSNTHDDSDIKVERNVYLPALGNQARRREIDILITQYIIGYPVSIAVECKNENKSIGSPKIDAFIGKLQDVGIPLQNGIYVSASGYTKGAIERAKMAGIRTLILRDLNAQALYNSVTEAFQSTLHLLPAIIDIRASNGMSITPQMSVLLDKRGNCHFLYDLIWQKWHHEQMPTSIGGHTLELAIPNDWVEHINGTIRTFESVIVTIRVLGLIFADRQQGDKYSLDNPVDNRVEKIYIDISVLEQHPFLVIYLESELEDIVNKLSVFNLIKERNRLPYIDTGSIYWPPNEKNSKFVVVSTLAHQFGKLGYLRPFSLSKMKELEARTVWELTDVANFPPSIDNRQYKMADALNKLLKHYEGHSLDIVMPYFGLTGWQLLGNRLNSLGRLRLLVGSKPKVEQSIGIQEIGAELTKDLLRELSETSFMSRKLLLIDDLINFLHQENVDVRLVTRGQLHAKSHILYDGVTFDASTSATLVIGSSNFNSAGLWLYRELNTTYQIDVALKKVESRNATVRSVPEWEEICKSIAWYEQEWKDAYDFKRDLIDILVSAKAEL
jgi:hypothetical protein